LSLDDARRTLLQGLELGTVSGNDGTVADQQPKAGALVPPYTRVNLVLSAPASRTGLALWIVLVAGLVLLALLAAQILRHRAQRGHWDGRIRVESVPDPNPTIQLREPDRAASFTVQIEIHPDHGVQSVREVVHQ
jgi:hypothetical protein